MRQHLLYVVGDSISIGYTPALSCRLGRHWRVEHSPGNAEDSGNVCRNINAWLEGLERRPDLLLLNCGLHDLKRWPHAPETVMNAIDVYVANLREVFDRLLNLRVRFAWLTTTPVIDDRHARRLWLVRFDRDVAEYNAAARATAERMGIPVIALGEAVRHFGADMLIGDDGVHFVDQGNEFLADWIAVEVVHPHRRASVAGALFSTTSRSTYES